MYKGETSVPEEKLDDLMRAAESLKIRGLASSKYTLKLRRVSQGRSVKLENNRINHPDCTVSRDKISDSHDESSSKMVNFNLNFKSK